MAIKVLNQNASVTSPFGTRILNNVKKMHRGIDLIGVKSPVNVLAAADGKVTYVKSNIPDSHHGLDVTHDYEGNWVKIEHYGNFKTLYMHLKAGTVQVKVGDIVKAGAVLGIMGTTGCSSGTHLHFGIVDKETYIDPKPYLDGKKNFPVKPVPKPPVAPKPPVVTKPVVKTLKEGSKIKIIATNAVYGGSSKGVKIGSDYKAPHILTVKQIGTSTNNPGQVLVTELNSWVYVKDIQIV